ncbi:hypothetical protein FFJ24_005615 [Pedobacter sp. KBS0701]|uniref:hypothetical protein n=1 Tax=Pedobacter sp. KBS0701 TaxID=2578106 RepID=UPI00110E4AAD|nr:hypothetical protein [Pedobacter sp. KBS0701]QDW24328.1 hypothetical protein FFJ24_005615 [Pedobacter sp. KBS0701]
MLYFSLAVIVECVLYLAAAILVNLFLGRIGLRGSSALMVNLKYLGITSWRASIFIIYASGYYYLKRHLEQRELELHRTVEIERLRI